MMSPSRDRTQGNMTDSEILRSPTEVLYAVSEKHRHRGNELMTSAGSQTTMERQSERSMTDREGSIPYTNNRSHNSRPPPPRAYVSNSRPRSTYNYSSREDLVSNDADPYRLVQCAKERDLNAACRRLWLGQKFPLSSQKPNIF